MDLVITVLGENSDQYFKKKTPTGENVMVFEHLCPEKKR